MSLIALYIRDKQTGEVHRVGDDCHDMIHIMNGKLYYHNLQCGDGCCLEETGYGGYEFVNNTDDYGYNCDPRE